MRLWLGRISGPYLEDFMAQNYIIFQYIAEQILLTPW